MSTGQSLRYKRILVPLGFAELALPHAAEIAHRMEGSLILVQVVPPYALMLPTDGTTVPELAELQEQLRRQAEEYMRARAGELRGQGLDVKAIVVEGSPVADQIIDLAQAEEADLVVMSTHGRSGLGRWVYGSVARKVLSGAHCPVLLIRAQQA